MGGKAGRERACSDTKASGGGRQQIEEPPWLLAAVSFATVMIVVYPLRVCETGCHII